MCVWVSLNEHFTAFTRARNIICLIVFSKRATKRGSLFINEFFNVVGRWKLYLFLKPKKETEWKHVANGYSALTSLVILPSFGKKVHVHIYVSQFTVETYCFADGRCLFKQPQSVIYHWNQDDEEISKKCRSVRSSVSPFVTLTKKPTPPSLLTV